MERICDQIWSKERRLCLKKSLTNKFFFEWSFWYTHMEKLSLCPWGIVVLKLIVRAPLISCSCSLKMTTEDWWIISHSLIPDGYMLKQRIYRLAKALTAHGEITQSPQNTGWTNLFARLYPLSIILRAPVTQVYMNVTLTLLCRVYLLGSHKEAELRLIYAP